MKRDVQVEVRGRLALSATAVFDRVADALVEAEVAERAKAVQEAVKKLIELRQATGKVRADQRVFYADGTLASEGWSRKALDERKKLDQQIKRLEDAIDGVMSETPNYDALRKATAGKTPETPDAEE